MNLDPFVTLGLIGLFILILRNSCGSKNKQLQKAAYLEEQGRFLDALSIYSRISLERAANMVIRTPEASQILVLRRLEKQFNIIRIEKMFIRLAKEYSRKGDPHKASKAYVFARKPFAAAKSYIDIGGVEYVPAAIQVIDQNIQFIHDRDQAIRNLARHSYNTQKFLEAAELLRAIGAEEESNTVLIAAASELKKQGFDSLAKKYIASTKHPQKAVQRYLGEIETAFTKGDIEQVRRTLSITKGLLGNLSDESQNTDMKPASEFKVKVDEFDRKLKILDSARDLLRKKNLNQSIVLYEELIESFGDEVPGFIIAEAALSNEDQNPSYSVALYNRAAELIESRQAADSFRRRARKVEFETKQGDSSFLTAKNEIFGTKVEENCSVCRMEIQEVSKLVRCPDCGSPAHYSHLAEWLKIRGYCPICKKKIKIKQTS
ncbi:MAG: hypothetical protein ACXAB2_11925 [Candidatus Hodarchaeales archaeon]|jgi:hypothetical protein